MQIQPLIEDSFFHIYNRGVNGEDLFKEERNYYFFLQQYQLYCSDVFDTLAYALMKNHFHLFVYIKPNVEVARYNGVGTIRLNASKQLSHLFNSYAQSINKAYERTGPLFESPFERKMVDDANYYTTLIQYCHYNPQLHGFVRDFKEWKFTSYHSILNNDNTMVAADKVLDCFGNKKAFAEAHDGRYIKDDCEKFT